MMVIPVLLFLLSALPAVMMLRNLKCFERAPSGVDIGTAHDPIGVSLLIPARNEAASIGPALDAILLSEHSHIEILVLDDHSHDATAEIVASYAQRDPRVRLLASAPLPVGWNGKQHACWQLAQSARHPWLMFLDADVRLTPDAIGRCIAEQQRRNVPLVSGFPYQETGTLAEKMLIPLMHFVLLGFLPIERMRRSSGVGLAAGCGQLFFADREAYFRMGGHSAIPGTRHDGIQLPRAFRRAGMMTDIFDATDMATCRMYQSTSQVVGGLLKNATEGIANPKLIVPFTVLLLGGSVLPIVWLIISFIAGQSMWQSVVIGLAAGLSYLPRVLAAKRFQQSLLGASLHPVGVLWFVALQWIALVRQTLGWKTAWRGRLG